MEFTRNIKRYLVGDDVKHVKDKLLALGYLVASTHKRFGNDSYRAAKAFQSENGLTADGIVGPLTWAALFPDVTLAPPVGAVPVPAHLGAAARAAIGTALAQVSDTRRDICLDALQYAVDAALPGQYPRSFYIRGGNLYNQDLKPNVMTKAKLDKYLSTPGYAPYYDGGRDAFMRRAAEAQGYTCTGADCSGGIVGLLRHAGVVSTGFDANANTLAGGKHAEPLTQAALRAGDWVHKDGHIGLYVGGGYAVEWIGGAYGCQLTKLLDRRPFHFLTGRATRMGAWTGFVNPTYY